MAKIREKRNARYWGSLIRDVCPSLYGKPIYDKKGNFIPYRIIVPKVALIEPKELVGES